MRLIADGLVDREGVGGLAARLSYSERQINRLLTAELGAGPLALARAQRAQTARTLIETTSMPITQIAFAAGFASVRQFNDTIREVFASSPTELRGSRQPSRCRWNACRCACHTAPRSTANPSSASSAIGPFPASRHGTAATYRRSLRLSHGNAVVALSPAPSAPGSNAITCTLHLDNVADAQAAVQRCRRLLDLDADPDTIESQFADDAFLGPLVRKRPGLRSPGHPDGVELLTRAVLGQQVSVKGARTLATRLVAALGEPLAAPLDGVTHVFPSAEAIAASPMSDLAMPGARARALIHACGQLAGGDIVIDAGSDRAEISISWNRCRASVRGPPATWPCVRWAIPMSSCRPTSVCVTHSGRLAPTRHRSRRITLRNPGARGAPTHCTTCGQVSDPSELTLEEPIMYYTTTIDSPVGELRIIASERGLRAILWGAEDAARIASIDETDLVEGRTPLLDKAVVQLEEYFAGTRRDFDLPLDPLGTPVPAICVDGAANDPVWRDDELRRAGPPAR